MPALKIVVIDDDPTGSQTVHSCPLLLRWDRPTLLAGLRDPSPLVFLLADTRALGPAAAAARVRQICRALKPALAEAGLEQWLLVSRGDSTLRGHFPLEVEVIEQELGPFDATLLVPAFVEGGRTTVEGVHLLHGEPVHHSPFAADSRFSYATSFLPDWAEAKSGGRRKAAQVGRIGLAELEPANAIGLSARLAALAGNPLLVVDAEKPEQLRALGAALRQVVRPVPLPGREGPRPRRLLLQSAASLLNGLANLPPQPLEPAALAQLRRSGAPGAVLVGSWVPLSNRQLQELLLEPACLGVELPVTRVLAALRKAHTASAESLGGEQERDLELDRDLELELELELELAEVMANVIAAGRTPVLFTSRGEAICHDAEERQRLGRALALQIARLAARLPVELSYLISKGGTTSQTLLSSGLDLGTVRLEGQLLPGLSLLRLPADHPLFPALPLLTFPGNLGTAGTLRQAWRRMQGFDDLPP
ncbi:four-carbon acid sugar kinase family protein [Synechococcus sp. CS-602]|uniref:four-carbon acid sugar kinase family protein n=1 Tax=Synechococcus sp. CS-602 TaxID=2847982 RepID=UPI0037D9E9EB